MLKPVSTAAAGIVVVGDEDDVVVVGSTPSSGTVWTTTVVVVVVLGTATGSATRMSLGVETGPMTVLHPTRREFLVSSVSAGLSAGLEAPPSRKRPKVAAIFTVFRFRSHAYNILENFFKPFCFRGKLVDPGVDVVSFYADQFPKHDMAREVAIHR